MTKQTETRKSKKIKIEFYLFRRIAAKDKIFFTQNLKTMINAGMPLSESLKTLAKQTKNIKFQKILLDLTNNIEQGQSMSNAMEKYPNVFSKIFVNMIAAGEASGNLENILEQLYIQAKKDHDLISKIRGAMIYPAIVLFAMIIMGIGMMIFVFPTFIEIFNEANVALPITTKVLIGISNFIINNGLIVFICLAILIILSFRLAKTKSGKKFFDLLLLKFIIIGPITQKVNLARFARSLSSLLRTDIQLIKSFEITSTVVGNYYYKEALNKSKEKIKKGTAISSALEEYPKLFPPMMLQMIMVGEKSGTTDELLGQIANFYEDEVDNITKNLSSIIEPLLILVIGAAVGLMAISVMMPMYNLAQQY